MTGTPLLWGADRTEIIDDLLAWLDQGAHWPSSALHAERGRGRLRPDLVGRATKPARKRRTAS